MMHEMRRARALCRLGCLAPAALMLVTACQPQSGTSTDVQVPVEATGAAPTLQPISMDEVRDKLPPELGCSFAPSTSEPALLMGTGFVQGDEPSKAAIKLDGRILVLTADAPGYEGLTAGPTFSDGAAFSISIVRAAKPFSGGFENQSWSADLVLNADGGSTRTYSKGIWTCGP